MKFLQLEIPEEADTPMPVTVPDWIQQGRINPQTATTQPELLDRQLRAAVQRCQNWCRRSFMQQRLTAWYVSDAKGCSCAGLIVLPRGRVASIETIAVDNVPVPATDYTLTGNVVRLHVPPTTGTVEISWISGYGADPVTVPDGVKEGIYEYATLVFETRLGERSVITAVGNRTSVEFIPRGVQDILRPFQIEFNG
jgi:hypothetical protein